MLSIKYKYIFWLKSVAAGMVCLFAFNNILHANVDTLAAWSASQSFVAKRRMTRKLLEESRLSYASNDNERELLSANGKDVVLLSRGNILASANLEDEKIIRGVVREEVKVILEYVKTRFPKRYKNVFDQYYQLDELDAAYRKANRIRKPRSKPKKEEVLDGFIIHILPLCILIKDGLMRENDLAEGDKSIISQAMQFVDDNSSLFFTGIFMDSSERTGTARSIIASMEASGNGWNKGFDAQDNLALEEEYEFFDSLFEKSTKLMPQIILRELLTKFYESTGSDLTKYKDAVAEIMRKKPETIHEGVIDILLRELDNVSIEKRLYTADMLAEAIYQLKDQNLGDQLADTLFSWIKGDGLREGNKIDVLSLLGEMAYFHGTKKQETVEELIAGLEANEDVRTHRGMAIKCYLYALRPDMATENTIGDLFRLLNMVNVKEINVLALFEVYSAKPELRQVILDKAFSLENLDCREWRRCENMGLLMARIAEKFPEDRDKIVKEMEEIFAGREEKTEEVKRDHGRGDHTVRMRRGEYSRGVIQRMADKSLEINDVLISKNIFNQFRELTIAGKSSTMHFISVDKDFRKLIRKKPELIDRKTIDRLHKAIKSSKSDFGIHNLGEVLSDIYEMRGDLVEERDIESIEKYLNITEADIPDFKEDERDNVNFLVFAYHQIGCTALVGIFRSHPEMVPDRIKEKVEVFFRQEEGWEKRHSVFPLVEIIKLSGRREGARIFNMIRDEIKDNAHPLEEHIEAINEIIKFDPSYIDDELVETLIPHIEKSFNSIAERTTEALITIASLTPWTHGRTIMNAMLSRINTRGREASFFLKASVLDVLKNMVICIDLPELKECSEFVRNGTIGFGLESGDVFYGLGFLLALSEKRDIAFFDSVLDMIGKEYSYETKREFFRYGYTFFRIGRFDRFVEFFNENSQKSLEEINSLLAQILTVESNNYSNEESLRVWGMMIADRIEVTEWAHVEQIINMAINNPLIADILMAKIIITMRYLRAGLGLTENFTNGDQIEARLPELRERLIQLLSIRDVSMLSKRNILKVLSLGGQDIINRLRREAIAVVEALRGGDTRWGLIGNIRNDIHNRPSPQHLDVMRAYREWVRGECRHNDTHWAELARLGYRPDAADVIQSPGIRERILAACDTLIDTLDTVYGDASQGDLTDIFNNWSNRLEGNEELKSLLREILTLDSDAGRTWDHLEKIVRARKELSEVINTSSDELLLWTFQLFNGIEILFYRTFNSIEKDFTGIQEGINILKILITNTILNGYSRGEMESVLNELETLEFTEDKQGYLRLYSIVKRIERYINRSANQIISVYQNLAEDTARQLNIIGDDYVWVENFSSNLFRADTIYLVSLAVQEVKNEIIRRSDISPWQTIVEGRMAGRFRYIPYLTDPSGLTGDDIVLTQEIPPNGPPVTRAAGIISLKEDSLLSHTAIRARQHGIPFAICPDLETMNALMDQYGNEQVICDVGEDTVHFSNSVEEEVEQKRASNEDIKVPLFVDIKKVDKESKKILSPDEYTLDTVGNKAFRLSKIEQGDEKPEHFTLGFSFYEKVLDLEENEKIKRHLKLLMRRLKNARGEGIEMTLRLIQRKIKSLYIPESFLEEIKAKAVEEIGEGYAFLRSSTNAEDLYGYAGAGLYDSYGMVDVQNSKDLEFYMKMVWMSLWNSRAYYDREVNGIDHEKARMAVLVHKMIEPEYSFVIHTKEPYGRKESNIVIELVQGFGETLVSGEYDGNPHRFLVNKETGEIRRISYANKDKKLVMRDGRMVEEDTVYSNDIFTLNDRAALDLLQRIAEAAALVEKEFEVPQDIEGCIKRDNGEYKFVFVQARDQQGEEDDDVFRVTFPDSRNLQEEDDVKESFISYSDKSTELSDSLAGYASAGEEKLAVTEDMKEQSLVLFADDILEGAYFMDLEKTIREAVAKNNIFFQGKIIIFAEKEENAVILDNIIRKASDDLQTLVLNKSEIAKQKGILSEEDMVTAVIKIARAKGLGNIAGIIKGPSNSPEALARISKKEKIPIVITSMKDVIYSFHEALVKIFEARSNGGKNGWFIILPPIRTIDEDIKALYEEYLNSYRTLVSA